MKCAEVQDLLGLYKDLPDTGSLRLQVEEHLRTCATCTAELEKWQESDTLILATALADEAEQLSSSRNVSTSVMERIYASEAWRVPIADRSYSISYRMRRNLSLVISLCLTLFVISFLYSFIYVDTGTVAKELSSDAGGLFPVASAIGGEVTSSSKFGTALQGIPIASLSDPFVLEVGPIHTYPDYLVVVSLLGLICALLTMNWLSRTRV